jgi:hypothetical protein
MTRRSGRGPSYGTGLSLSRALAGSAVGEGGAQGGGVFERFDGGCGFDEDVSCHEVDCGG